MSVMPDQGKDLLRSRSARWCVQHPDRRFSALLILAMLFTREEP